MRQLRTGERVTFLHYGRETVGVVVQAGTRMAWVRYTMPNGRERTAWLHRESIQ